MATTSSAPSTISFRASPGDIISTEAYNNGDNSGHPITHDTIVEGAGCTLLPGFIDSSTNTSSANRDLQTFVSFGIAAVLNRSSAIAEIQVMRAASRSGSGLPSYFASGTVVTSPSTLQSNHTLFARRPLSERQPKQNLSSHHSL
ncbi:Fc.00g012380.m01.CDS01 [Cosmosporella sp. VM-42]